jgi:uncharacterized membrane protein
LEQTEALTTSPWATFGTNGTNGTGILPVITPGQEAPDGSLNATRIQLNLDGGTTTNDRSGLFQNLSVVTTGYVSSFYVKPLDGTTGPALQNLALFGSLVAGSGQISSVTDQGNGWFLIQRTTTSTVTGTQSFRFQIIGTDQQTLDVLVWHPQLELGSTPTAYQRVTTAFDVTEAGQRDCYGVRADGIDDGYVTGNIDFTGTDKVTIFAALRKLSDATSSTFVLANSPSSQFSLSAPSASGANSYRMTSKGDGAARVAGTGVFAAAPDTAILRGFGDISAPLVSLHRNGVFVASSNLSQGAGNFPNTILELFSNAGTNFCNGNLYALIVAGGSYPLSTIQRVERLLSRITPTVNL